MANHEHHYNGSVKTLVEMTRRASRIIEELDPDATVVCPSVTKLWTARAHRFLTEFAALGGYQYCDAAGVKLYQRRVTDPPETILDAVREVEQTFHKAGNHLPLWNTGTTQTLPLNDPLEPEQAADHAVPLLPRGSVRPELGPGTHVLLRLGQREDSDRAPG
ncbi:hypothetical protein LV779_35980 [Streptomyces thinghirensis]|nr:hypothetical protein [Streptomyces thinghirensis]